MLDIAYLSAPYPGQACNGDAVYVRLDREKQSALICMIDGLGHGVAAARAAEQALAQLSRETAERAPTDIIQRLDVALRGGRGAAATVCTLNGYVFSACGVGNVALRSRGTNIPFVLAAGVLGARVPALRPMSVTLRYGDRVVLHTDGVSSTLSLDAVMSVDTKAACTALFEAHRKKTDDATLLVLDVGAWQ